MASVKEVDDRTFDDEIKEGTVLVDFSADWCGPCRMLSPILDALAMTLPEGTKILKVDVDQSQGLALRYNVTSVPTLLLFKNGTLAQTIVGLRDLTSLQRLFEES